MATRTGRAATMKVGDKISWICPSRGAQEGIVAKRYPQYTTCQWFKLEGETTKRQLWTGTLIQITR